MKQFGRFYLDREKDIIVDLYLSGEDMHYVLRTPNHSTGTLITNLAKLCSLPISRDENGLKVIRGRVPCYINAYNQKVYIFRLADTKVANIYPDGQIKMKAAIPSISKTLMSQTKHYDISMFRSIVKSFIFTDCKFRTDLHTHMNANLSPDILIALGIHYQIRYPLYYIRKLGLRVTAKQQKMLERQRAVVEKKFADSPLTGKYLDRKINDNTFINFADFILNNISNAAYNIAKIRASLSIPKDGQAVFANLEKVYLYRYVFTRAAFSEKKIELKGINRIPDEDIVNAIRQMEADRKDPRYAENTLYQDELLWIARGYRDQGIEYVEISDTNLVKEDKAVEILSQVHEVMPKILDDTGVMIRFLAAVRRIPLTIVKDNITPNGYLQKSIRVLKVVAADPYVAGCDIVGEEINDIRELRPVLEEFVKIAAKYPCFTIRIHAGESDCLKDNVENSIKCVHDALAPGQKMPYIRIGHGVHTPSLSTQKGRDLIKLLKKYGVVLEFQITSNVRLNNLTSLEHHPLKRYLAAGVKCVQGTDGAALYGTSPMDEQLALERLLGLTREEMHQMKRAETEIEKRGIKDFEEKSEAFDKMLAGRPIEKVLPQLIDEQKETGGDLFLTEKKYDSEDELGNMVKDLPQGMYPVIIAGGSFNNDMHTTRVRESGRMIIEKLVENGDPAKMFFVIGHSMTGYEKYLLDINDGKFRVFSYVPSLVTRKEEKKIRSSGTSVRISIEPAGMGLYKSISYEIFRRRPSALIAFDGNSGGANLIQEAKNCAGKCAIYVSEHSRMLKTKAESLKGYVTIFGDRNDVADEVLEECREETSAAGSE
ncbi:MAG: adenosine deaminase [Oscillospiraceae bacterium]|jgi:hypothetical protein